MDFFIQMINGLGLGSIYALVALGYSMVYGIIQLINFAHGDIIMVGAYVVFMAMSSGGVPALPAVLLSIVVCTVLGVVAPCWALSSSVSRTIACWSRMRRACLC